MSLAGAWAAVRAADAAWLAASTGDTWCAGIDARLFLVLLVAVGCALLAIIAACVRMARTVALFLMVGIIAGLAAGALGISSTLAAGEAVTSRAASAHEFTVETDARLSSTGSWRFEASTADGALVWVDVAASHAGSSDTAALPELGEKVRVVGRWRVLDPTDEFDASLASRGVCARMTAVTLEVVGEQGGPVGAVRAFRRRILEALDPYGSSGRALVAGVVCGMQAALAGFEVNDDFADLGLSHLVAVSGSHLAVVAGLVGVLAARSRLRPGIRLAITASLLAVYVAFTGFQASAVRSWAMASLALGARVAGRRPHGVSSVSLAALVMLLADPSCAANMGFALSVLSVLGLAVFAAYAEAWTRCLLPRRTPDVVVEGVSLTLVAQAFTAPVCLPAFGTLALLSPIANVVAGPLVSLLLIAGLACVGAAGALPSLASVLLLPCDALAAVTLAWAQLLAGIPGAAPAVDASAPVLAGLLAACSLVLYAAWPRPGRARLLGALAACALVVAVPLVQWRFLAPARIVVLDVGQGDAILVQDGAHALLVDTGPGEAVRVALAREHVLHLDAVVLTHTDADHAGGLEDVARTVGVEAVVLARGVSEALAGGDPATAEVVGEAAGANVVEVGAGDALDVGRFTLEVLWPQEPVDGANNEDSIVTLATFGDGGAGASLRVLLTGDAESSVVGPLVEAGEVGEVDVLKAGHHGSRVSTTEEMVAALDPLLTVASAGEGNRYGHPTEECVAAATSRGGAFLCTKDVGDVELRPAADGVEVRCARTAS